MRYWDSSALVSLLVNEGSSDARQLLLDTDPTIVTWWGTLAECESALARLRRQGGLEPEVDRSAQDLLNALSAEWSEIEPEFQVRSRAIRLLRVHPLRAADAFQLAAALIAVREYPAAIEFVSNDRRLAEAARLEGFATV